MQCCERTGSNNVESDRESHYLKREFDKGRICDLLKLLRCLSELNWPLHVYRITVSSDDIVIGKVTRMNYA